MLDDYGLRLLAEMGIDVYLPRNDADRRSHAEGPASNANRTSIVDAAEAAVVAAARGDSSPRFHDILLFGHEHAPAAMLADLLRSIRLAGLDVAPCDANSVASIARARGLIVLGEKRARELGASLPAQRQNAVDWVVVAAADELGGDAAAKRALWGEIKRLSRSAGRPRSGA